MIPKILLAAMFVLVPAGCSSSQRVPAARDMGAAGDAETTDPQWIHEEMARDEPLEFLRSCRQHYLDTIRDYQCTFRICEQRGIGLSEPQTIAIKFRENPYSVDMRWLGNTAGASRISYVKDRWVKDGRQLALVVPSGLGGLVLPGGIKLDIHGREFRKSASRSVDEFGFRKTLERAISLCESARDHPEYELRYAGRNEHAGRPQYAIERRLPFSEGDSRFPDRLTVFFIDAEWLVPKAVWSYADEEKRQLLGEFITSDETFNVGLTDQDFE